MRETRLWTLFWRARGDRRWTRGSRVALHKSSAIRLFQGALIAGAFDPKIETELRTTKVREADATIPPFTRA